MARFSGRASRDRTLSQDKSGGRIPRAVGASEVAPPVIDPDRVTQARTRPCWPRLSGRLRPAFRRQRGRRRTLAARPTGDPSPTCDAHTCRARGRRSSTTPPFEDDFDTGAGRVRPCRSDRPATPSTRRLGSSPGPTGSPTAPGIWHIEGGRLCGEHAQQPRHLAEARAARQRANRVRRHEPVDRRRPQGRILGRRPFVRDGVSRTPTRRAT